MMLENHLGVALRRLQHNSTAKVTHQTKFYRNMILGCHGLVYSLWNIPPGKHSLPMFGQHHSGPTWASHPSPVCGQHHADSTWALHVPPLLYMNSPIPVPPGPHSLPFPCVWAAPYWSHLGLTASPSPVCGQHHADPTWASAAAALSGPGRAAHGRAGRARQQSAGLLLLPLLPAARQPARTGLGR